MSDIITISENGDGVVFLKLNDEHRKNTFTDDFIEQFIAALGKVGLMLNVRKRDLPAVLDALPALQKPTVSTLSDEDWLAVNTILDESTVRIIIPRLKEAGAEGIVEYPLNKIVL